MNDPTVRSVAISSLRPASMVGDLTLYSNYDHELDTEVEAKLRAAPDVSAAHHAWDFNGRVWWTGTVWREQVWRYRQPVAEYESTDLRALIAHVNGEHGHE